MVQDVKRTLVHVKMGEQHDEKRMAELEAENKRLTNDLNVRRCFALIDEVKTLLGERDELVNAVEHHFGFDKAPDLIDDYRAYRAKQS